MQLARVMVGALVGTLVVLFAAIALAQEPLPPPTLPALPVDVESPVNSPFGLGWGGGIGMSDNLDRDLVREESGVEFIDNRVVFTKVVNVRPRILMESHYTWKLGDIGLGPAMWLQLAGGATSELFNAFGGGGIVEIGTGPTSFNVLFGIIVDFNVRSLHPAYIQGLRPPFGNRKVFVEREELQGFIGFAVGR